MADSVFGLISPVSAFARMTSVYNLPHPIQWLAGTRFKGGVRKNNFTRSSNNYHPRSFGDFFCFTLGDIGCFEE